jgi:hypothetical protein
MVLQPYFAKVVERNETFWFASSTPLYNFVAFARKNLSVKYREDRD